MFKQTLLPAISAKNINLFACQSAIYYWQESELAFKELINESKQSRQVQDYQKKASYCRAQYQAIQAVIHQAIEGFSIH